MFNSKSHFAHQRPQTRRIAPTLQLLEERAVFATLTAGTPEVFINQQGLFAANGAQLEQGIPSSIVTAQNTDTTVRLGNTDVLDGISRISGSPDAFDVLEIEGGQMEDFAIERRGRNTLFLVKDRRNTIVQHFDKFIFKFNSDTWTYFHNQQLFGSAVQATFSDAGDSEDAVWNLKANGLDFDFTRPQISITVPGTENGDTIQWQGPVDVFLMDPSFIFISDTASGADVIDFGDFVGKTDLIGGPGADFIAGGSVRDIISGGDGIDVIQGNAGNDRIAGGSGNDEIDGGLGDDTLTGGDDNDTINGGEGDDHIVGEEGADVIRGGPGNDTLLGVDGGDTIFGDEGNDTIRGGDDRDTIDGGAGDDTIEGNENADVIRGGAGDDLLNGGGGNDEIEGGPGNDALIGTKGDDVLSGDAGNDVLDGGNDADILLGGDGDDEIQGGTGNDIIDGGTGNDQMFGGKGDDTIRATSGNNLLNGEAGNDILEGGSDADDLQGGKGDDILSGNGGDDQLFDTKGDDQFIGGDGDDTAFLSVGGSDIFLGGAGTNVADYSGSGKPLVDFNLSTPGEETSTNGRKNLLTYEDLDVVVGTRKNDSFLVSVDGEIVLIDGGNNGKSGDVVTIDAKGNKLDISNDNTIIDAGLGSSIELINVEVINSINTPEGLGGSVHGRHFADFNGNNILDEEDSYLSGVELQLVDPIDNSIVAQVPTEDLDINSNGYIEFGIYGFTKARPGTFEVRQVKNNDWLSSDAIDEASIVAYELDSEIDLEPIESKGGKAKWMEASDNTYFISTSGQVHRWDGNDANEPTGELVAELTPVFYNHIELLTDAAEPTRAIVHWRPGESVVDLEFGSIPLQSISGQFATGDGQVVVLYDEFGEFVAESTTQSVDINGDGEIHPATESGFYTFDFLLPGEYVVVDQLDNELGEIELPAEPYSINEVEVVRSESSVSKLTITLSETAPELRSDAVQLFRQDGSLVDTSNLVLSQVDDDSWGIEGLASLTNEPGTYQIRINMSALNSPLGVPLNQDPLTFEFEVSSPTATSLPGDANRDGKVDFADFLIVSQTFGSSEAFWETGDFNADGLVNFNDFLILSNNFGKTA